MFNKVSWLFTSSLIYWNLWRTYKVHGLFLNRENSCVIITFLFHIISFYADRLEVRHLFSILYIHVHVYVCFNTGKTLLYRACLSHQTSSLNMRIRTSGLQSCQVCGHFVVIYRIIGCCTWLLFLYVPELYSYTEGPEFALNRKCFEVEFRAHGTQSFDTCSLVQRCLCNLHRLRL